jgi:hypothetical protein
LTPLDLHLDRYFHYDLVLQLVLKVHCQKEEVLEVQKNQDLLETRKVR